MPDTNSNTNDPFIATIPTVLQTQVEATRHVCPYWDPFVDKAGRVQYLTCRGSECMSWRWAAHLKIENREPRPVGYCGRVHQPPILQQCAEETILKELPQPNAPASRIVT